MSEEGDLQVWWMPQIPCKAFDVPVKTLDEAVLILNILAKYDDFQLKNNIKPDYCNAGGLNVFEDGEWSTWYDEETGVDIDEWESEIKPFLSHSKISIDKSMERDTIKL